MTSRTYSIFLYQCWLKAGIFEFWFWIRPMGKMWSTLNRECYALSDKIMHTATTQRIRNRQNWYTGILAYGKGSACQLCYGKGYPLQYSSREQASKCSQRELQTNAHDVLTKWCKWRVLVKYVGRISVAVGETSLQWWSRCTAFNWSIYTFSHRLFTSRV